MKDRLSDKLISAIEESMPPRTNLAGYLTKELFISKEAAYRRLRGDVPFTLEEASIIANKLNISLDKLSGNDNSGAIINMSLIKHQNSLENYDETIVRFLNITEQLQGDPSAQLHWATNMIPFILCEPYMYITKFRIARWLHQSNNITGTLSDIEINKKTLLLQSEVATRFRNIPVSLYIWDTEIISSFIKQVQLFSNLRILVKEDIYKIKEELYALIDDMEKIAADGCFNNGGRAYIHLSNINLEASYGYIESDSIQISTIRIYAINIIDSRHPDICRLQKEWIHSLRRYSTLITESSEMERLKFFNKQREYVNNL